MIDPLSPRQPLGAFPRIRPRRMRADDWSRRLMAEHRLSADDLIWPVFVVDGVDRQVPVASMPGVERLSIDLLVAAAERAAALGIPALALFPVVGPEHKTEGADEAWNPDNLMNRAIRALKGAVPQIGLIGDIALDTYTVHGHDGLLRGETIVNDETIEALVKQSLAMAEAGVDVVAPSDMMDGRIGVIRDALDGVGLQRVRVCSYAAKYASAFYGPFRDAVESGKRLKGDKRTYQMDPANAAEALREVAMDLEEGADLVIVKPGMPYLDIIRQVKDRFACPVLAYHVSGEYASLKAAAANGWIDYDRVLMETLMCFKRAGTDGIMTYAAMEAAELMRR